MNLKELVERACKEQTLVGALAFIAISDTDRIYRECKLQKEDDFGYETRYHLLFGEVFKCWHGIPPYAPHKPSELDVYLK